MRKLGVVLGGVALVAGMAVPVGATDGDSFRGRFSALQKGRGKDALKGGRGGTGRGARGDRGAGGGTGGPRYHRLEKGHAGQYFECGWIGCASEWVDPYHGSSPGAVRYFGDRYHYYDPLYYAVTYPESQLAGLDRTCDPTLPVPVPADGNTAAAAQQPVCRYDPRCDCFYHVSEQPPSAQIETPPVPDANTQPTPTPTPTPTPDQTQPAPLMPQPSWAATRSE